MKVGNYKAVAREAVLGEAGTGKEQLGVSFEIVEAEDPANQSVVGERITGYFYFSEKTFKGTVQTMRDLGWEGDDVSEFQSMIDKNSINIRVNAKENLDGSPGFEVRVGGGVAMKKVFEPTRAKAFAASFRSRLLASGLGNGKDGAAAEATPAVKVNV